MCEHDATTARIFDMPPYFFFYVMGAVFALSLFILLLLKYNYSIPRYTKIFILSAIGLLIGARMFGFLSGLYIALANNETITIDTFLNTGIVFYGGMLGFLFSFLLICKIWDKEIDYRVMDIAAVCVPLFHFWGRLGCFFSGCCFGIETDSLFSVLYITRLEGAVLRFPVQLIEASLNIVIFVVLMGLLFKQKLKEHLLMVYLFMYAIIRFVLEFFRGDLHRGVWNGVSLSQVVSVVILISCTLIIVQKTRRKTYEVN